MIFRRLNEAPDMTDEPLSAVSRKPSEINVSHLPEDTLNLIKQGKWTEAYRTLINAEDIEVFIEYFLMKYDGLKSFQKQLRPIHDPLVRLMRSLGDRAYQPETNPMLTFLNSYFAQGNEFNNAEQFRILAGWWGDGIVIDKNLKETKVENSILLNPNLYNMSNNTFIVQAYYWLSDKKNVSAYLDLDFSKGKTDNGDALNVLKQQEQQIDYIIGEQGRKNNGQFDIKKLDVKKFRNLIIFVNAETPHGAINEASEIQARLNRMQDAVNASREAKGDDDESDDDKPLGSSVAHRRWTANEVNKILTSGISNINKDSAEILVSYFLSKGYIR